MSLLQEPRPLGPAGDDRDIQVPGLQENAHHSSRCKVLETVFPGPFVQVDQSLPGTRALTLALHRRTGLESGSAQLAAAPAPGMICLSRCFPGPGQTRGLSPGQTNPARPSVHGGWPLREERLRLGTEGPVLQSSSCSRNTFL